MKSLIEDSELGEEYSLRLPKKVDLDTIHKIYIEAWNKNYEGWGLNWSNNRILVDFHRDRLPLSSWSLLEYDDSIVGFLRHSVCSRKLEHIVIKPEYWRTGGGYRLLKEYFERVIVQHPLGTKIFLEVFKDNENAVNFFENYGYKNSEMTYTAGTSKKELLILKKDLRPIENDAKNP